MASFSNPRQEHVITLQIGYETNKILSYLWASRELDVIDEEGKVLYDSGYHLLNERDQLTPKCVMVQSQHNELDLNEMKVDLDKLKEAIPWKVDEKENSHWYYQRKVNNGLRQSSEDSEEITLDSIRYFAEASDRVDTIDVYADIYGDLGMINANLVERLRDDYGKSISIPVWLLDHCHVYDYHVQNQQRLAPLKTSQLFSNSLLLNYSNLLESADILIPLQIPTSASIEDPNDRLFHYRLTGAVALETCLAYRQSHREYNNTSADSSLNEELISSITTKEWINVTTHSHRLPICSMEAFIPALTHDVELNQDYIFETFKRLKLDGISGSKSNLDLNHFQYNPFMKSFAIPSMFHYQKNAAYVRPFANTLAFRGYNDPDFVERLFLQCVQSSYLLTKCSSYSYGVPMNWQDGTNQTAPIISDQFYTSTAVGNNAEIGDHLREETVKWHESVLNSIVQYAKIDMGKEDIENKREIMLQLSESYL